MDFLETERSFAWSKLSYNTQTPIDLSMAQIKQILWTAFIVLHFLWYVPMGTIMPRGWLGDGNSDSPTLQSQLDGFNGNQFRISWDHSLESLQRLANTCNAQCLKDDSCCGKFKAPCSLFSGFMEWCHTSNVLDQSLCFLKRTLDNSRYRAGAREEWLSQADSAAAWFTSPWQASCVASGIWLAWRNFYEPIQ